MAQDLEYFKRRIAFLEQENQRTLLALEEILNYDSYFISITENTNTSDLFRKTCSHLNMFTDFETIVFQNLMDNKLFKTSYHMGNHSTEEVEAEISHQIERRYYAQAINDKKCLAVPLKNNDGWMIFHCLYSKTKILGMFIGIHKENILETRHALSQLISVLMRKTGHFLSLLQKYNRLHNEVRELQVEVQRKNFELKNASMQASFLEEARKQMLANISHEFRTPLNAIIGLLDLMRDSENLTPEYRDYIKTASMSATSIISLIDELLCYVKIKSTNDALILKRSSLREIIEACISKEAANAEKKDLSLEVVFNTNSDIGIITDSNLLCFALQKLISNSIKFTDSGKVSMTVNIENECEDHADIYFEIKDTGIGFDSSNLNFLCQPFTQEDSSSTRKFEGMGMGLAVASLIIESLGGTLQCDSEIDSGAKFFFNLKFSVSDLFD